MIMNTEMAFRNLRPPRQRMKTCPVSTLRQFGALLLIAMTATGSLRAAESAFAPRQWWLVGPYACYSPADFEANEAIENAKNTNERGNEWNRVVGMGGRELRSIVVEGAPTGLADLDKPLGPVPTNVCAYAGFRVRAEKAGMATATLRAAGPVRWFLNNKLIAETKQAGVQKTQMNLAAGLNCLLAKSWKTGAAWTVGCTLEGVSLTSETVPTTAQPAKPLTGRRNVALCSEASQVAVSSIVWRGFPINERGLNMLNDGRRDAGWTSLEVDQLPQWAWVRFPGLRKIDEVVVHAASDARRPLELVGEYTADGGVTFKTLFRVTDPKDLSIRAKFPAVETDNVRIRIDRVAVPERSGFAQAQLTEIEVFGDDVAGAGSLALAEAASQEALSSRLKADTMFKPAIHTDDAVTTVSTPWYRVVLDRQRPRIAQLQLDSLGKGEFKINLLRRSGATALVAPLFDRPAFLPDGDLKWDGNVARYPAVAVAPGVRLQMALRFHEKSFDLELATDSSRNLPLEGGVFRFDLDFWQTPTTFFGRSTDRANFVALPCYMHAPDAGTFHVTQSGDAAIFRQCASADDFDLSARQFMNIAPRAGVLPAGGWRSTLNFEVVSAQPFPEIVAKEPRLAGLPRYALNIAQWTPSKRVLINNIVSTPCPLSLQFYVEMAAYAPVLADGISTMDLVVPSVDGYLNGLGGHLYWHGMKVEVTPPGKWTASLETPGFLINSGWYAVRTVGGKPLLDRWLPRLEAIAGHLEAHDTDGDGIVDSADKGHWFDTYKFPAGVKEAHSTAVNYEAFLHLAELEELAGRTDKASHCRTRAKLIKDNYLKMFFNPATGVIGGWRDLQGKLHDPMFPWVNGYAICAGLVDDELAKRILAKCLAKMKDIGFTQYQYGLPTNLLPMQKDDWNQHGAQPWQGYMNGSLTPPYSHYFLMALYRHGFREEAERMLWAQVGSFDKGTFNSGVRIPHMPPRNPVGSAFYYWDGSRANGEGYLPENWHAYATIFAGHYGIRFDKNGYSLEPWSPLKGKMIRCGMPVNGRIQQFVEECKVKAVDGIKWTEPYEAARQEAKQSGKAMLVFVGNLEGCKDCQKFIPAVCSQPEFIAFANANLVCTQVLEERNDPQEVRWKKSRIVEAFNIPNAHAVIIANADGKRNGELSTHPKSIGNFIKDIQTIIAKAPSEGRLKYCELDLFDKTFVPEKTYASPPPPAFSKEPLKGRYLAFMTGVRVHPWEVTRARSHGTWMQEKHTPAIALKMRSALAQSFPGARMTWAWSWHALNKQSTDFVELRALMGQFHKQYGDEITFWPGVYFEDKFNTIEQSKKDLHEGLALVSQMVGNGYRPQSVVAGIMSVEVMKFLAESEGIHVVQGQIWSQFNVDGQGGDGGIIYPYYPSRDHYLKPAQGSRQNADFLDVVNIDGWSVDFFAARNNGGGSRDGIGPLETHGGYGLGIDYGLKEMMHVTDVHFNEQAVKRNGFGFLPDIWELCIFEWLEPDYLPNWLKGIRAKYQDTQMLTLGEFGELWRAHNPDNSRINLQFVERGNGTMPSPEEGKRMNPRYQHRADLFCPEMEIRWYFNKDFRFATIQNWKTNGPKLVMDYTRYNQPYKEPSGNVVDAHWDLMDLVNQKQTRPQDRFRTFSSLPPEEQKRILKWHPEVGQK